MEVSKNPSIAFREIFAEFIGSLMYSFFNGYSLILQANSILTTFSDALIAMALFVSLYWMHNGVSANQFNPILTLAMLFQKKISLTKAGIYMLAQFIGSYVGAIMLLFFIPNNFDEMAEASNVEVGCPHLNPELSPFAGMLIEMFGCMVLTFVYLSVTCQKEFQNYSPSVGMVYGFMKMSASDITGAALDPFRYLGPALVSLKLHDAYIYIISPVLGALLGTFIYKFMFPKKKDRNFPDDQSEKMELVDDLSDDVEVLSDKLKGE